MELQTSNAFSKGTSLFEEERWSEAEECFANAALADPEDAAALHNRGLCLERLGDFEQAAACFARVTAIDPHAAPALLGRGLCLLRLGRPNEALPCLDKAVSAWPAGESDDQLRFGRAVALHQLGRLDEAAVLYHELLSAKTPAAELLANIVALAATRRDDTVVREFATRLLLIRPQSRTALEALAAVSLNQGDYGAAVRYGATLAQVARDSFEAWFHLGLALQNSNRFADAAEAYREALRIKPTASEAALNLSGALEAQGDWEGARLAALRATEIAPTMPGALWNTALLTERAGNPAESETYFKRLLEVQPENVEARFHLGFIQLQSGAFAEAASNFERCAGARPDWSAALLNRSLAYWKCERLDDAWHGFNEVLAKEPDNAEALRALAAIAVERRDPETALDLLQRVPAGSGRPPELCFNLGLLFAQAGDLTRASHCYELALGQDASFLPALVNLGHVLHAEGLVAEAREMWQKAAALQPA